MAINKKETKQESQEKVQYNVKVLKVTPRPKKEGCYRINLEVNGITIYGMEYVTYTSKEGKQREFIAFPQYQDKQGGYWNHVYFPINDPNYRDVFEAIETQIGSML